MPNLYKYKVYCNEEDEWYEKWDEIPPTVCPNNSAHSINLDKTFIVSTKLEEYPVDISGKLRVQQTSRKLGTVTYWTGASDNEFDLNNVGDGDVLLIKHIIGEPLQKIGYIDLNCINNETYIHDGYIAHINALLDNVSLELVSIIPSYNLDGLGDYNISNGIIVPAVPGTGQVNIISDITSFNGGLTFIPNSDLDESPNNAYWDADWNGSSYENIIFNPLGNGRYNIFAAEVTLARFVNKFPLAGTGLTHLKSSDSDQIGQGMRIKIIVNTIGDDHDWSFACALTLHRKKTINL